MNYDKAGPNAYDLPPVNNSSGWSSDIPVRICSLDLLWSQALKIQKEWGENDRAGRGKTKVGPGSSCDLIRIQGPAHTGEPGRLYELPLCLGRTALAYKP